MKEIVTERGLQEDALLKDSPDAACRVWVLVLATLKVQADS